MTIRKLLRRMVPLCLAMSFFSSIGSTQNHHQSHQPIPLGSVNAKPGGTFRMRYAREPASLNPIVSAGSSSVEIQFYVMEGLLLQNEHTYGWQPWLADRWTSSRDGRVHEFHLRENAVWSDGVPVTSADVKFSFDVLFDDRYPTAHMRPYYAGIAKVEVVDRKSIRFTTKSNYFGNFFSSAGIPVVPKHIYGDPLKGPAIHKDLIGSGPYKIERWNEGRNIVLVRNPRWWGWKDPLYRGKFQPQRVVWQFVGDENVALEKLRKGDLDFMSLSADQYIRAQTMEGPTAQFQTERVRAKFPQDVSFIGFNMNRPLFQDRRVRLAMAHLVDREMMIAKFFRGFMVPATGPWYRQSEFADPTITPIPYKPAEALRLLRAAGWDDRDHDGWLEKTVDDQITSLRFTIVTSNKAAERWLTVFKEDARKIGVDIEIKVLNENTFSSFMDTGKYDAADLSSGGWMVEFDPQPKWHSKSLKSKGGLNYISYNSPTVDRLIESARNTPEFEKRIPFMRDIYRTIADDVPAIFLFNGADIFYAFSKKMQRPAPTFNYDTGLKFWWVRDGDEL